ncbi:hypothetical protein A9W99_24865 [Mycobacterium sp. 1164966.3]|nr:hypothetical protein A9W99_24865 [Mycobacterium sp. 1164966.3]
MLNFVDSVVALIRQIGEIVLKAQHAVVRGSIASQLESVFLGDPSGICLTTSVGITEIICSDSALLD